MDADDGVIEASGVLVGALPVFDDLDAACRGYLKRAGRSRKDSIAGEAEDGFNKADAREFSGDLAEEQL
jgi:hypothetical protein